MLTFRIAYRFVISKKFQSILIIIGFSIGISTNIFIGNLISAIEQDLIARTIDSQAHITLKSSDNDYIDDFKSFLPILDSHQEIEVFSKILEGRAFITNIDQESPHDILVRGMGSLEAGSQIYNLQNADFQGQFPQQPNQVMIGKSMAETLNITIGDRLNLSISPIIPLERIVYVSSIFEVGQSYMNELWLVGDIVMAGMVLFSLDKVNSIVIQLYDHMKAESVTHELIGTIGRDDIMITSWMSENQALLNTLRAQSISTKLVQFFILLSVSIAIGAMLSIAVVNKQRQIGILKAMGLSDQDSSYIFLFQGLIISSLGATLGLILGFLYIGAFNYFGNEDIVTVTLEGIFTVISVLIAVFSGVIAAILPAKTSKDVEIIDIIRRS